jgi:hypothetical protein
MRRLAVLLALSIPCGARAGNDDGILVGGQAALVGGAITAITSDGAAAWYNPAGLARIERHSFDINASAYGISATTAHDFFTLPDGQTSNASVVDWQLIPSALSYTRVLSERVVGSFGVFIPSTSDADLRASLTQANGMRWTVGLDEVRNEYDYIASVGIRVRDNLRVGVALHGVYISDETMIQVGAGTPGMPTTQLFEVSSEHETRSDYAARLGLGVQWTPRPGLDLGLSLQTPTLTGFRRIARDVITGSYVGSDTASYESEHVHALRKPFDVSTPLFVRMGAAYTTGRIQWLCDGSISTPIDGVGASQDRRLNGNVRLGALVTQSAKLSYGAGLFSDRSSYRQPQPNFFGFAGGVRIASDYTLKEGQRALTFATTLAGRYAYGWGDVQAVSLRDDVRQPHARLQVHELTFNLGGSVTF